MIKNYCRTYGLMMVLLCAAAFNCAAQNVAPPIPKLAEWETNMRQFGQSLCNRLANYNGYDQWGNPNGLIETYYDAQSVFLQIADYTGENSWRQCAERAERIYRDRYVLDANNCGGGFCPGYWNFTEGARRDFLLTGDATSKQAAILLSQNAGFARDNTPDDTSRAEVMREISYAVLAYLDAEELGEPRRVRLAVLVNHLFGHFDQVFVTRSFEETGTNAFMVGLAAQALIRYREKTGDSRVLPKIKFAADELWSKHWDANSRSFWYYEGGAKTPAPDLNLLIAPLYAWLYQQTGNRIYLYRGDAIFAGGIAQAYLGNGKQFNQNYRWSFDYVRRRSSAPLVAPNNPRPIADYDGDGATDIGVFRPSNGTWYLWQSRDGFAAAQWGIAADKLAPADFDGDGKTDFGVFRSGFWYLLQSSQGFRQIQFGAAGDVPVPADYDGDGKAEIAVYRPSSGVWYKLNSANNQFSAIYFGAAGDVPLRVDYDGDGKSDITVYRPSNNFWYWLNSSGGQFKAIKFGASGDVPTAGDFDGDGATDISVFRPLNGFWFRLNSSNAQFVSFNFGTNTDLPQPGDYDGDGVTDIGVFRPSNSVWYRLNSSDGSFAARQFGAMGDLPISSVF